MSGVAVAPELRTRRLDVVALDPARDAVALHRMHGDPRFAGFGEVTDSVPHTRRLLERTLAGNGGWTWVLRLRPSTDAVGTVGIFADQGTPIRGLSWHLAPEHWGQGLMSEAARAVVDHLLGPAGFAGLEAWIDSDNERSLGVARHARLSERGRLPRVYDDRIAQSVVMVRGRADRDPDTLDACAVVPARDVAASVGILSTVFGMHVAYAVGEPLRVAKLAVGPWSGSPGLLVTAADGPVHPLTIAVEVGVAAETVLARVVAAGLTVLAEPAETPWSRRVLAFALPDGHRVDVVAPSGPRGCTPPAVR